MASQLQLAPAAWRYRLDATHQQTRPNQEQPVEAPQLERDEISHRPLSFEHDLRANALRLSRGTARIRRFIALLRLGVPCSQARGAGKISPHREAGRIGLMPAC